jgi:hypothetical protein
LAVQICCLRCLEHKEPDAQMQVGVANLFIFMICIFANFEQLLLSSKVVFWGEIIVSP